MASSPRMGTSISTGTGVAMEPSVRGLRRWLRIVGGFYVLLGLFNTPPVVSARFPAQYPDLGVAANGAAARALIDVWFMFGLEVAVIGVALLWSSRDPLRALPLVWVVLGLELVRGIVDDLYLLSRGYDPAIYVGWIVVHLVIVVTGVRSIRSVRRAQALAP